MPRLNLESIIKTKSIDGTSVTLKQLRGLFLCYIIAGMIFFSSPIIGLADAAATCNTTNTVIADVVALDQPLVYNRLGAINPTGMIFALRRDVVIETNGQPGNPISGPGTATPGQVMLRPDKRPRPIVLRMNVGDCLQVNFENLLDPVTMGDQPATRNASVHVMGLQLVNSIASDGSWVGQNPSSLVPPGGNAQYTFYAERENTFMLYSTGATTGGEGDGGSLAHGLFGAVNVEPQGAEWYRSQLTAEEMELASDGLTTPDGHPLINYDAVYPDTYPVVSRRGLPILKMKMGNEIVHSDINSIITGPGRGNFENVYLPNPVNVPLQEDVAPGQIGSRSRNEPFREFTVIFHDEINVSQAFPGFFNSNDLGFALKGVKDGFAINYGTGGVGSEIIANRLGVGPMADCIECKYEEFFLTSWAVGDPAMVVDIPANTGLETLGPTQAPGQGTTGAKATKAFYSDDPSNVHHSYTGDHVKFRNVHAGPKEHHIFHLHSHQWLFTPNSDNSSYLDSQMIGPGSGYTYEIAYNGAGNRNQVVGDSIFHCHFYPHFAQGMWEMWRNHDVFENGTKVDALGNPLPDARALPDNEIKNGTPIPAVVPIPGRPMAPVPKVQVMIDRNTGNALCNGEPCNSTSADNLPADKNPGYPFFIPGTAGHRPPHPPLDTVDDGGLPRHVITDGTFIESHNRTDFNKELLSSTAIEIPETGTKYEKAAMNFHEIRFHETSDTSGNPAWFKTNGLPRQPGAPYSDPCVSDTGVAVGKQRNYSAAVIQLDLVMNKVGWHFPQERMIALWGDVNSFLTGTKPPEPFFFRANTNDCITFNHTNLVPNIYVQDDYQVKTPTDIIGQHIHLVKFDVTSADGSANGWNYEDGTYSPDEVRERIHAINESGGLILNTGQQQLLEPEAHPYFGGTGPNGENWLGAQTTVQRWYADNVLNMQGKDRTLRTVFSHDHYGPSSHQQVGVYSGLVVEPENSTWLDPETNSTFGNRFDGGPTSWKASIWTQNPADSYREFLFEFADFQHAYEEGGGVDVNGNPIPDPIKVINPPAKNELFLAPSLNPNLDLLLKRQVCPNAEGQNTAFTPPCPEAISVSEPGTMVVNYRNEPMALRVLGQNDRFIYNKAAFAQAPGMPGDLSYVYKTLTNRSIPELNTVKGVTTYPDLTGGVQPGDPFTPLLRVYENDSIQIRTLVGAHEEGHNFNIQGIKWKMEPSDPNSGFSNTQGMGISEHFEFRVPEIISAVKGGTPFADYLYEAGTSVDDRWNGLWGIMRSYNGADGILPDLKPLPSNPEGKAPPNQNPQDFQGVCPREAPRKTFSVVATTAAQALPGGRLVYNNRNVNGGPLYDPAAILYILKGDLDNAGKLKPNVPVEPLIIRANAGDCIDVTLTNNLPNPLPPDNVGGYSTLPMIIANALPGAPFISNAGFNNNQLIPSNHVGLHSQLVSYDLLKEGSGSNIGFNPIQTAAPGGVIKYRWYAGDITIDTNGNRVARPIEFGATNLISSDPIRHSNRGAIGALIIEPQGSTWTADTDSRAKAMVMRQDGTNFREFVLLFQDDVNLRFGSTVTLPGAPALQGGGFGTTTFNAGNPVPNTGAVEAPEDSGQKGFNYRTEPLWFRMGYAPNAPFQFTRTLDFSNANANVLVGGDPKTPVFTAARGTPVVLRVLEPGGHSRNSVFQLHGHIWEREPYILDSTKIGSNPLSQWIGSQEGHGPTDHFNMLLKNGAGGAFNIPGDYLYRNFESDLFSTGEWGIVRVN